jgi:hypothetical protein
MPRASWKGFFAPVAGCRVRSTCRRRRRGTKSIRLHQVWQPKAPTRRAAIEEDEEDERLYRPAARSFTNDVRDEAPPEMMTATRVSLLPHYPRSGEEIEREEVASRATNTSTVGSSPSPPRSSRRSMSKAPKSSTSKASCRAPRSIRFISARPITSIRTVRSRSDRPYDRGGDGRSWCCRHRPCHPQPARAAGHGRAAHACGSRRI